MKQILIVVVVSFLVLTFLPNLGLAANNSKSSKGLSKALQAEIKTQQKSIDNLCKRLVRSNLFSVLPNFCNSSSTPTPSNVSVSLSANPTQVAANGTTTLSWQSTGANFCEAKNGWSGSKVLSGSQQVNVSSSTSFAISCGNNFATSTAQVTINVLGSTSTPPLAPECSDGKDNDSDGKIDFPSDPGCTSASDSNETDATQISIINSPNVPAQNISANVPNQPLGGFQTQNSGPAFSSQGMTFTVSTSSSPIGLLSNVVLVDGNGVVIAGPVDASWNQGTETINFSDKVTFPSGTHTFVVKGRTPQVSSSTDASLFLTTNPSNQWLNAKEVVSGINVSLSSSTSFNMSTMSIKAPRLSISMSPTPTSQNIVPGGTSILFANVVLDASQSGEDVRLASFPMRLTSESVKDISSCQFVNGGPALNTGSNVPASFGTTSPAQTVFHFDNSLIVPKNTIVTLGLRCNLSPDATNTYMWGISNTDSYSATGVTSGNTLTNTPGSTLTVISGNGGLMTTNKGSISVSLDPSSPIYRIVANGTTGATIGVFKFTSTNEAVNLSKISLRLSSDVASSGPADIQQVTLWDGATQIGTATFTGTNRTATSTLTSIVTIPKDGHKEITIKGDIPTLNSQAGIGTNVKPGAFIQINLDQTDSTGTQGTGVDTGKTINATGSTDVAGIRVFKSYPIFAYSTASGVAFTGVNDLLSLNIEANSSGDIQINKLTFIVSTTTAQVFSPTFTGPGGNVNSTPISLTSDTLTVLFDNPSNTSDRFVGAGQTKTYILRGTVRLIGNNGGGTVAIGLKADSAYPSLPSPLLMGDVSTTSIANSNIIWSPNSTTTSSITNNDWTNGYGLPGCFTAGLGQNCSPRVITR
jgi:hypothetical protein